MDGPGLQYRCDECVLIHYQTALVRDRWGDPCCPECRSPRLTRHRTKLSAAVAAYFLFNVF